MIAKPALLPTVILVPLKAETVVYEFTTPEDFIYYILFCLEQLKMNPDTVNLYISGSIEKEEDTYKILYHYIRNITFYNVEEKLILTEKESLHQNLLLKLL